MAKASLVVMAAGIGSRFGKGIKQLEGVGPKGELIMDYSIYDAIKAGFDKVVFIIRRSLYDDFKKLIGDRIAEKVEVQYAFQETDDLPEEFKGHFSERIKPWGTGQAVLACKDVINEPFAVINADDYYGREAFSKIFEYLTNHSGTQDCKADYVMAAYYLKNTLSENGTVSRGVVKVIDGYMSDIEETYEIRRTGDKAVGEVELNGPGSARGSVEMDLDTPVSMNMWGLYPSLFDKLEKGFKEFLSELSGDNPKGEYLLPMVLGEMVEHCEAVIHVLDTNDKWFGMTYAEDVPLVRENLKKLTDAGFYEGI